MAREGERSADTLVVRERDEAPQPEKSFEAGDVLGSYRLLEELGAGSVGRVFRAEHVHLGRRVALKMLRPEHSHDPKLVRRFFDEARAVNAVAHPNIVSITDFVLGEDHPSFFIMELLEGMTLRDLLESDGVLSPPIAIDIALQLSDALAAVHQKGIVHRDLKPANVFLLPRDSSGYDVRLLDFGIAKFSRLELTHDTRAGTLLGTPEYMSPEATFGVGVDHRADLYALGLVLYEALTGLRPFARDSIEATLYAQRDDGPPPIRGLADISPQLEALILSCLEKTPDRRPQDATELGDRLRLLTRPRYRPSRPARVLLASSVAVLLFTAALLIVRLQREPAVPLYISAGAAATTASVSAAPVLLPLALQPSERPDPKKRRLRAKPRTRGLPSPENIDHTETWSPFE